MIAIIAWLNIIAFLFITFVITYKKKNRMAERLNYRDFLEESSINKNKYLRWLNPFGNNNDLSRLNVTISIKMYWLCFLLGLLISVVFVVFVLRFYILIPLTLFVGLALPSVLVFYRKRKHRNEIYDELSSYINSTANLAITYGEPINALREIVEKGFVEEPILSDVKTILLSVDNGMALEEAFKNFENRYGNITYLQFFHENLVTQLEYGGKMSDVLVNVAKDYDKALSLRIEANNDKAEVQKNYYQLLAMVSAIPLILMGFSYDYYLVFVESIVGKSVFAGVMVVGVFATIQMEKIYDKDSIFIKSK